MLASIHEIDFKSHSWVLTPHWKVLVLYWYPIPQGKPCVHSRLYSYFPGIKSLWFFLGGTQWFERIGSSPWASLHLLFAHKKMLAFEVSWLQRMSVCPPRRTGMTTSWENKQGNGSCLGRCLLSSLAHGNSGREEWADEGLMRRKQGECLQRLEGKLRVLQGPVTSIICT